MIPQKLREDVLKELHKDHPGIVRMKSIARSYVWWEGVDKDIESLVKSCQSCQAVENAPPMAPLHPWLWPSKPWQQLHLDFAAHSKEEHTCWLLTHTRSCQIVEMKSTTAGRTVGELCKLFSSYRLPEQIVSNNGPQFVTEEFASFAKANGIKHIKSAQM